MDSASKVTQDDLQDYVEGRLRPQLHSLIEQHLDRNPDLAAHVGRLRLQVEQFRQFGESLLREPFPARFYQLLWHHSA